MSVRSAHWYTARNGPRAACARPLTCARVALVCWHDSQVPSDRAAETMDLLTDAVCTAEPPADDNEAALILGLLGFIWIDEKYRV